MVMAAQSNLSVSAGGGQPSCSSDVIARADAGREHDIKIRICTCDRALEHGRWYNYYVVEQSNFDK